MHDIAIEMLIRLDFKYNGSSELTEEYSNSTMVAFSTCVSTVILESTFSHCAFDAFSTVSQFQSGTSDSALAHAWSVLINETPNLARTLLELKESKAPAWMSDGEVT